MRGGRDREEARTGRTDDVACAQHGRKRKSVSDRLSQERQIRRLDTSVSTGGDRRPLVISS
jgi:hypothetical protein